VKIARLLPTRVYVSTGAAPCSGGYAGPAVLVVTEGEGSLGGEPARAGDAFAVPAAAEPFEAAGGLRVLRCLAPDTMGA
jgi:hypothetical protein